MKKLLLGALALASLGVHAELKDKVYKFMPLHSDLSVVSANGERSQEAVFTRATTAMTPDFKVTDINIPRFYNGGLLIEHGGKTEERGARNLLPAQMPVFAPAGKTVPGICGDAMEFSGKWELKPVALEEMPMNGTHIFSFYAKGKGVLSATGILKLKNGTDKMLKTETFALDSRWKRFYIRFNSGTRRNAADLAQSFRTVFSAENATISAPMLEGPGVYFGNITPTSYIPQGGFREADKLKLSVLRPELGMEGAVAFEFIPMAQGGWQGLLSADGGWKPELQLSYYTYSPTSSRLSLQFRGKTLLFPVRFETEKKYSIVVNWTKEDFSLWVNGKKAGEVKAPGIPFKTKEIFLGSRSIQVNANGLFRNFALFAKPLDEAEILKLSKEGDLSGKFPVKEVSRISPFACSPPTRG